MKIFDFIRNKLSPKSSEVTNYESWDTGVSVGYEPATTSKEEKNEEEEDKVSLATERAERVIEVASAEKTIRQIAEEAEMSRELARHYVKKFNLPFLPGKPGVPKAEAKAKVPKAEDSWKLEWDAPVSILIIPDAHAKPEVSNERFLWLGRYIAATQPSIIVNIGDLADMPSLSHYDVGKKSGEGRLYQADLEAVHEALELMEEGMAGYKPKRKIITLGNHENRISRKIEEEGRMDGTVSLEDLRYADFGWEVYPYKDIVMVEGIAFTHHFPNGLMDKPMSGDNVAAGILRKFHCSGVQGHRHDLKFASEVHIDGRRITAIVAGCYFNHREDYVSSTTQKTWWRGLTHLHNVKNGEFDVELIRMEQVEAQFGSKEVAA